jgi:hypothetical protein
LGNRKNIGTLGNLKNSGVVQALCTGNAGALAIHGQFIGNQIANRQVIDFARLLAVFRSDWQFST